MNKLILLLTLFAFLAPKTQAQDSNFKAQGYYYKAKSQYESASYSSAVSYARKSITALGGTNEELQYLIVMTYVGQKDWVKAEKELSNYSLVENRSSSINIKDFNESVDRLTNDEKRALAQIMVDIEESAEGQRAKVQAAKDFLKSPEYSKDTLVVRIAKLFEQLVDFESYVVDGTTKHKITITKSDQNFKHNTTVKKFHTDKHGHKTKTYYYYSFNLYDLKISPRPIVSDVSNGKIDVVGGILGTSFIMIDSKLEVSLNFKKEYLLKQTHYWLDHKDYSKDFSSRINLPTNVNISKTKANQLLKELHASLKELKLLINTHNLTLN
jgi:hypothetical protein